MVPEAWAVRPPITMVEALISRPSSSEPASPMKILAGWKLKGRKPRQTPQVTTAISGPMFSVGRFPRRWSWMP